MTARVPVIALTGHLGAGKTSLLNHLLRAPGARLGVIVDDFGELNVDAALVSGQVIDAVAHFQTVDTRETPPNRFAAATLVVIGKADLLDEQQLEAVVARICERVRARNPDVPIVRAVRGGIDPALVFDTAADDDPVDPLPLARLLREQSIAHHDHEHARAVSVPLEGPVPPRRAGRSARGAAAGRPPTLGSRARPWIARARRVPGRRGGADDPRGAPSPSAAARGARGRGAGAGRRRPPRSREAPPSPTCRW